MTLKKETGAPGRPQCVRQPPVGHSTTRRQTEPRALKRGPTLQGSTFPGPCEFPGARGSACDAEGPEINAKFQGKGVDEPGVHAAGAGGNAAGEGGNVVGKGSELGGALGAGTGERARARAFAAADGRTKHPV
ncbi:hypothetical protein BJV77DRAFT_964460 [Russula vinacea]|nr:hypothetical protein BJV77DRAFT_964460 [Russula vinacea]